MFNFKFLLIFIFALYIATIAAPPPILPCFTVLNPSKIVLVLNNIPTKVVNTVGYVGNILQFTGNFFDPMSQIDLNFNSSSLAFSGTFHRPTFGGLFQSSSSDESLFEDLPHGSQPDWTFYTVENMFLDGKEDIQINFSHHHHHKVSFVLGHGVSGQPSLSAIYYFSYERVEKRRRKTYHGYLQLLNLTSICSCTNNFYGVNAYNGTYKDFGFLFPDYYLQVNRTGDLSLSGFPSSGCTNGTIVNVYGQMTSDAFNRPFTVSMWLRSNVANNILDVYPPSGSFCYYTLLTGHIRDPNTDTMLALREGSQVQVGVGASQLHPTQFGLYMESDYKIIEGSSYSSQPSLSLSIDHERSGSSSSSSSDTISDEGTPVKLFLFLNTTCTS